jgi:hypothetical protein
MNTFYTRLYATALLALLTLRSALAQEPEGESPYSSSTVDTPEGSSFLEANGVIIILAVVFLLLFVFLFVRGRRRA